MKRVLCLTMLLCLFSTAAFAQAAVETQPLSGEQFYPAGTDAQTASYVFRYAYPQFKVSAPQDKALNAYYASLASDMTGTVIPDTIAGLDELPASGTPAYYTHLDYRITANTEDYLSVLFTSQQFLGNTETESWSANVFARSGVYEGQAVSLSQAMGLEQADGATVSANSYASELVYGLIWQITEQQQAMQQKDFFAGLTRDDLEQVFSPESDFYLDGDGNFVFFIQSGAIASEVEGVLTYPFSMAELLSAVTK